MKRLLLFVFILFSSVNSYSFYGFSKDIITFSYGSAYRFDKSYRHVISIDKWMMSSTCTRSKYSGFGINSEFSDKSNYLFGARYFKSPVGHPAFNSFIPLLGIEASWFSFNESKGLLISPRAGFHFSTLSDISGLSIQLLYAYDFSLMQEQTFPVNRNRVTLKLGLDLNIASKF
jgi:hypothetical protein